MDNQVESSPAGRWLGVMAPKRNARRAVTRNLVKRLARGAFGAHEARLAAGLWLVRLRQPISRTEFVSAHSSTLAAVLKAELDAAFEPLAGRSGPSASPGRGGQTGRTAAAR